MKVKIFGGSIFCKEEIEKEINEFMSEDGGEILDTYLACTNNNFVYLVEYADDEVSEED